MLRKVVNVSSFHYCTGNWVRKNAKITNPERAYLRVPGLIVVEVATADGSAATTKWTHLRKVPVTQGVYVTNSLFAWMCKNATRDQFVLLMPSYDHD